MKTLHIRRNPLFAPLSVLTAISLATIPSIAAAGQTFALWSASAPILLGSSITAEFPPPIPPVDPTKPFQGFGPGCWDMSNNSIGKGDGISTFPVPITLPNINSSAVVVLDATRSYVSAKSGQSYLHTTISLANISREFTIETNPNNIAGANGRFEIVVVPAGQAYRWTSETRPVIELPESGEIDVAVSVVKNQGSVGFYAAARLARISVEVWDDADAEGRMVRDEQFHMPGWGSKNSNAPSTWLDNNPVKDPVTGVITYTPQRFGTGNNYCVIDWTNAPEHNVSTPSFPEPLPVVLPTNRDLFEDEEFDDDPEIDDPELDDELEADESDLDYTGDAEGIDNDDALADELEDDLELEAGLGSEAGDIGDEEADDAVDADEVGGETAEAIKHDFPLNDGEVFGDSQQLRRALVKELAGEFTLVDDLGAALDPETHPDDDAIVLLYDGDGQRIAVELDVDGWPVAFELVSALPGVSTDAADAAAGPPSAEELPPVEEPANAGVSKPGNEGGDVEGSGAVDVDAPLVSPGGAAGATEMEPEEVAKEEQPVEEPVEVPTDGNGDPEPAGGYVMEYHHEIYGADA